MKHQALLLALVVLISLLIGSKSPILSSNSFSVFMGDFASAMISQIGKNLASAENILIDNRNKSSSPLNPDTLTSQSNIIGERTFLCNFEQPNLKSQAILVKNLKQFPPTSETIFQLNSAKRWPIASLSKLMTAVIALEQMDINKQITLSAEAVQSDGTLGDFKVGEIFRLDDLIKAMLIVSSNDAAYAIAENFDGGRQGFINEMQKKAAELRMFSTSYLEPTGLSFINQSTADDLSKLVGYIYSNHPEILEISRQPEINITELKSDKPRKLSNIDEFAGEVDFIGGKTGYIDESNHNLIALFNINAREILTIVFGSNDAFAETKKIKNLIAGCE